MDTFFAHQQQTLANGNIFPHLNDFSDFSDEEYETNDVFSEVCSESESEMEYDSDDDIDEKIKKSIKDKKIAEEQLAQLQEMSSVFQNRLHWLNKVPSEEQVNVNLPTNEFPTLASKVKNQVQVKKSGGGFLLPQNASIKVLIGEKTFIEFAPVPCKLFAEGKCTKGNTCEYDHKIYNQKQQVCKFILAGRPCKFTNCKFSHQLENQQKIKRAMCRNGEKCENKNCTFTHTVNKQKVEAPSNNQEFKINFKPKPVLENKKFMLCRNMFEIINKSIKKIGVCRFGDSCCFAHSLTEIKNAIEASPDFKCKFDNTCKGVVYEKMQITKNGKVINVLKYENTEKYGKKCFKIHKGERVTDYIIRTQSKVKNV